MTIEFNLSMIEMLILSCHTSCMSIHYSNRVEMEGQETRKKQENNYSARAEEIGRKCVSSADEVEVIELSADASRPYLPGCYSFS